MTAYDGNVAVGHARGLVGELMTLQIKPTQGLAVPWDPADDIPKLYDLRVALSSGDVVTSYVGLRSWAVPIPSFGRAPDGPMLHGVNLGGDDMLVATTATQGACKSLCTSNTSCVAYVYSNCTENSLSKIGTNCWLKSGHLGEHPCTDEMRAVDRHTPGYVGLNIDCAASVAPCMTSQRVAYRSSARPTFNGHPRFFAGVLDQSWWPDGQYVAPTDAALASDLIAVKAMGFEMVRLHQKINPERWYWHADRLGVAVFQDMPQKYLAQGRTNETVRYYVSDLKAIIAGRASHPCILQWTAFNEGDCWSVFTEDNPEGGGLGLGGIADLFKQLDPDHLLDLASGDPSGGSCPGKACPMGGAPTRAQSRALNESGDVSDVHTYPVPGHPLPGDGHTEFGIHGQRYAMIGEYRYAMFSIRIQ